VADLGGPRSLVRAALPAFAYYYTVGGFGFWLPLYLKGLGWEYRFITWAATAYFLAITPSTLAAGLLADATGRPDILVCVGLLANAVGVEGVMAFHNSYMLVYLFRVIQGLGLATALPIALGSLSLIAGVRRGVTATALTSALGMAVGTLVSGFLVGRLGLFTLPFDVVAAVSVASSLAACGWRPPVRVGGPRSVVSGLRAIPASVALVAAALVARNFFSSGVFSVLSVIFNVVLGVNIAWTSVALAANPIAEFLAAPLASRVARGRELPVYSASLAATGLVFYMYLHAGSPLVVVAAQALLGVVYVHIMVSGNNFILTRSPEEIRYTASSIYSLAFNLGWILGTLASGPYMDAHGPKAWVSLSIAGCVAAGLLALAAHPLDSRRARGPHGAWPS